MNTIRFTSKALFVALLSTGLLAPISANPGKAARKIQTQSPVAQSSVKNAEKAGMLSSAYNFAKANVKTAGIGFVAGAAVTGAGLAAYKYGKQAWNYAKQHPYKAAAIAAGTTAAVVGGLYGASKFGYLTIPTYTAVKESASTAATSAYNYAKENKLATALKTAVGLGSAATGSTAVLGANAYLTAEKTEAITEVTDTETEKTITKVDMAANCNSGNCRKPRKQEQAKGIQQRQSTRTQPSVAKEYGFFDAQGNLFKTGTNKKVIHNGRQVRCTLLSKLLKQQ